MSEVIRYLASHTPYEGLDLNGQCARHDGDYFVSAADFDRVTAERDALQQRLTAADEKLDRAMRRWKERGRRIEFLEAELDKVNERADVLEQALKFYADREHYHFESGNWDTVSGEPLNILWNGDEPDFIEDGSIARAALKPAEGRDDE